MFPPSQGLRLDVEAISGICGSISIACWIVVFSPQIIENFRRSSSEGLSILFIIVWLAGDVFNILGAVLQGVLPTMIILAVYYTFADIVLLAQCFYYKGFTLTDEVPKPVSESDSESGPTERSALLTNGNGTTTGNGLHHSGNEHHEPSRVSDLGRSNSYSSFRERLLSVDGSHLSPVVPLHDQPRSRSPSRTREPPAKWTTLQSILFNLAVILLVCASGIFGWWLSTKKPKPNPHRHDPYPVPDPDHEHAGSDLHFNVLGQIFGYICALLYLGSRVPQLLLNYRRKSTDGVSMLFFLFACIGNLTYVMSILAYSPNCGRGGCRPGEWGSIYGRYIAVNLSWLVGSFGTLLLDAVVFVQFFMYQGDDDESGEESDERR